MTELARVVWKQEDVEEAMLQFLIERTDGNIERCVDAINWDRVEELMIEVGWNYIENVLYFEQ